MHHRAHRVRLCDFLHEAKEYTLTRETDVEQDLWLLVSLLNNYPIGTFVIGKDNDEKMVVIDGRKRLSVLLTAFLPRENDRTYMLSLPDCTFWSTCTPYEERGPSSFHFSSSFRLSHLLDMAAFRKETARLVATRSELEAGCANLYDRMNYNYIMVITLDGLHPDEIPSVRHNLNIRLRGEKP